MLLVKAKPLPEGKALEQLKGKGYADKYQPIYLFGVEFSSVQRQTRAFEVETLSESL